MNCFNNPWNWPGGHEPYPPDFPHWLSEPIEYPPGSGLYWWEVDDPQPPGGNWSTGDESHPIFGPPNTPFNTLLCWIRYLLEKTKLITSSKSKEPLVLRFMNNKKEQERLKKERGF